MSENTKITDHEWTPWRMRSGEWVLAPDWKAPVKWNKAVDPVHCVNAVGERFSVSFRRPTVLVPLADWLDPEVPVAWLGRFLALIQSTPNLTWLLLTKRPENWESRLNGAIDCHSESLANRMSTERDVNLRQWMIDWLNTLKGRPHPMVQPPANVRVGTSVEDQPNADKRIPALLQIPAVGRFLSVEPMLGPVDFRKWLYHENEQRIGQDYYERRAERHLQSEPGRNNLEGFKESGKGDRQRVSSGQTDERLCALCSGGAPGGLHGAGRTDTGWVRDQSQERAEGRQPPGEPGGGDVFRELPPFSSRDQDARCVSAARGTKPISEVESGSGRSDQGQKDVRGAIKGDRSGFRRDGQNGEQNRTGSTLGIDWIILGGESGPGARPCKVEWIRSGVKQCRAAGVPAFVKQLGARPILNPCRQHHFDWRHETSNAERPDDKLFREDGDHWRILLNHPKGGDPAEWPEDLRVREFPEGLR